MAKEPVPPALSEAQFEIMDVVWQQQECTVGDVWKVLHERRGIARNTVHTLMVRLEEKGWLTRRQDDGVSYRPAVSREEAQQQSLRKLVDTVFNGSPEGLVLALLSGPAISKAEAARIRKLIDGARRREL